MTPWFSELSVYVICIFQDYSCAIMQMIRASKSTKKVFIKATTPFAWLGQFRRHRYGERNRYYGAGLVIFPVVKINQ